MRFKRLLLLVIAAAAVAGVAVPSAGALAFEDQPCIVQTGGTVLICPPGSTGKAYSLQIKGREGTGCVPYVTFKAVGTLPDGLSLSSDGWIKGTPAHAGEWTFWIQMQDIPASEGGVFWCSDNKSTERQFSLTIVQGLQIVQRQSTLTPAQLNATYSLQFSTTGGGSPTWAVSSGSLPAGITLNSSTGLLAGTPTATGDYTFKITAADGSRSDSQTYTLSVVQPLKVTNATIRAAEVGLLFGLNPQASGGKPGGYAWSLEGTLPAGLSFDPATGAISGKPSAAGSYPLKLKVTDTLGLTQSVDVPLVVAPRLLVAKRPLKAAKVGAQYKGRFLATGGVLPRQWHLLGGLPGFLPPGIKLDKKTGELSGTPTKPGVYRLRMQVVDKLGAKSSAGYVLKVSA